MVLPLVLLLASFIAGTLLSLLGAYFFSESGAILGMVSGLGLCFVLIARYAGR